MSRKGRLITVVVLIVGALALVAIVAIVAGIWFLRPSNKTELVTVATDVGKPNGPATTKSIGPAGGSIASPDGRITVTVPPNDVPGPVEFSITPITNQAQGGIGNAYRLEPNGQKFATPVEVSFKYTDQDLEGTVPEALTVGYQDEKRAWHLQKMAKLDQAAKIITISTTHFTDEAFMARLRLEPPSVTLHVGESKTIHLLQCEDQGLWNRLWSRPLDCSSVEGGKLEWKLDGPGGISASEEVRGTLYKAPAKRPTPNLARVFLKADFYFWNSDTGVTSQIQKTFESRITIIGNGYRASGGIGDVVFSGKICDLAGPFSVYTNHPLLPRIDFAPFPDSRFPEGTTGVWVIPGNTVGGGGAYAKGNAKGDYTVEGPEIQRTGIVANGMTTITGWNAYASATKTKGGPVHIVLTPLTGNECK